MPKGLPRGGCEHQAPCKHTASDTADAFLPQAIPNAWLAGAKGHPFWMFCVQQVIKRAGACAATNTDRQALQAASPRRYVACSQHLCNATAMAAPVWWQGIKFAGPFDWTVLHAGIESVNSVCTSTTRWDWLEATTGPVMLWGAVEVYKRANNNSTKGLTILPVGAIYPIDWRVTVWGPKDGPGPLPAAFSICCAFAAGCAMYGMHQ